MWKLRTPDAAVVRPPQNEVDLPHLSEKRILAPERVSIALIFLAALSGCGPEEASNTPQGRTDTVWELVEDLRIGVADGPSEVTFGGIAGLEIDDLGRVWVLDSEARELRVFDSDGTHVRTIGRQGPGPGEFQMPLGLARHPDGTMWVIDSRTRVYSVFDTTGALVNSLSRPLSGSVPIRTDGFDREGRLMEIEAVFNDTGVERFPTRVTPQNGQVDSLKLPEFVPNVYEAVVLSGGGVARYTSEVPFAPTMVWHTDAQGFLWHGATAPYRIFQTSPEGDTLRIIERSYQPVPVQREEREEAIERLEGLREMGARIDEGRIPSVKPAFEQFFVDEEGYVWVIPVLAADSPEANGLTLFEVFDPEGEYLGSVQSPVSFLFREEGPHLHPIVRDGNLYGVTIGELEEQSIVRLRIVGR